MVSTTLKRPKTLTYLGMKFSYTEVAVARATLIWIASIGETITYSDWCAYYGWKDYVNHEFRKQPSNDAKRIGVLAGLISLLEFKEGRPLLTAVVVRKDSEEPGKGFQDLLEETYGSEYVQSLTPEVAWKHEREQVYRFWNLRP